ncbi:intraflagellar transport protein 46 homolog isoform X3 [Periplaneta americana]|uniref:intraflagellar transport protein 46 homolog isoform X3 n=1 Tax=Periplaneta americana TaxID=6978 RepID=UPI0037E99532
MSANKHSDDDDQSLHLKFSSATMYDESIDVTGAEEVKSPTFNSNKDRDVYSHDKAGPSNDVAILEIQQRPGSSHVSTHRHMTHQTSDQSDNSDDDDDDDDDNDDDDDVDVQAAALEGTYDPNEFSHLPVSPEVKDLFQNITRYTPQNIELDYKLRPFIPDFIPAVGDIDAFLKIPRPDGKSDSIGLKVLDEPCAKQSEPAVLHLQLRAVAKQSSAKAVVVKRVECAEKNTKAIDRWMKDISDLHRSKPPPTVHYSKTMPDIDSLMQEWPADVEQQLRETGLPIADLDCDLPRYVDIVCSEEEDGENVADEYWNAVVVKVMVMNLLSKTVSSDSIIISAP